MTKAKVLVLVVAAVLLTGSALTIPERMMRSDAPAIEVETSIRSVTHDPYQLLKRVRPGLYRCTAIIHDEPGSHRILPAKDIVIGPGESDETTNVFENLEIVFSAKIAKELDRAETVVTLKRDGKVVNRQKSTVWLERLKPFVR